MNTQPAPTDYIPESDLQAHIEDDFCYVNLIVGSKETGYRLVPCRWEDLPAEQKLSANINTFHLYDF